MNCINCKDARKVVNRKDSDKVGCSLALVVSRVEEEIIASDISHKNGYMYVNTLPCSDDKGLMKVGVLVPHDYLCSIRTQ
jgi:hypothetical protein